jgi:MHS family alpha-ketoglutarate permease-like MFS transporter
MTAQAMAADAMPPIRRLRSIIAGSAGNLVECFDWFTYAAFALYFAKVFFPAGDQTAQLLNSAAVYAVGFLARPLGAWLMGLYGDRVGRRSALIISVLMMAGGSLAIGLCPGHAQIGLAAPVILVAARIFQGISMGGEYGTSATYMSEMAGRAHRGFWSGVFYSTLMSGQLISLGLLLLLNAVLTPHDMQAFGWRIPFLLGGALARGVFWMRQGMDETPSFHARSPEARLGQHTTTLDLIKRYPRQSLMVFGLTAGGTLGYYTFGTYGQKFLANTAGFSKTDASLISAGAMLVFILAQPLLGSLSDRIGRRPLLIAYGVLGALTTWPTLALLAHTHDPWAAFFLMTAALLIVCCYTSVNAIVKAELFPTEVRALGVALPYAFANAIFGGGAEYVALWFKQAGHESGFFTYVTVVILASLAVYLILPDTRANSAIAED